MRARCHYLSVFLGFTAILVSGALFLFPQTVFAQDIDYRNIGGQAWVTPIRDQSPWGTCWDFGSVASLEAKYMLTRNDSSFQPDLAEQNLVDVYGGIDGGQAGWVFGYAASTGICAEAELPYTGGTWPLAGGSDQRVWKNTANLMITTSTTANFNNLLRTTGPITIGLNAYTDLWTSVSLLEQYYHGPGVGDEPCRQHCRIRGRPQHSKRRLLHHQE